ncbi:MAG TPA: nodulation protein NfeD [Thermoanaerobaculia bacterium]|nr:nodulation protein NfeD [Thermoanaerobaculia bacterium]
MISRLLATLSIGLLAVPAAGAVAEEAARPGVVIRAPLRSIIHPIAEQFLVESLEEAEREGASALVVELDTPGGLLDSTRAINSVILASKVPVVVWVGPSGARAASAGFFLLMAADVAAMAPGTNTGAAHPVAGAGEAIEGVMADKAREDAAATIRALASQHGRDPALAEKAVVESRAFTAEEALENGLVDLVAEDFDALLSALDGREVRKGERSVVLRTAGAQVRTVEMSAQQRLLSALAHPNIAYILLTLGFLGIYFELSHPGAVLPGVVGGICLLLAFFGLSVLPVNYAGVALILLALLLFVAEVKVTSYGLLTVGGIISLVLGSLLLFRSAEPALRVSLELVVGIALGMALIVGFLARLAFRAAMRRVTTGVEGLLGARGVALSALAPKGKVKVAGEYWNAIADVPIEAAAEVEVTAVDGLTLHVGRPGAGR